VIGVVTDLRVHPERMVLEVMMVYLDFLARKEAEFVSYLYLFKKTIDTGMIGHLPYVSKNNCLTNMKI